MALFCKIIPHIFRQNKTLYPPQRNYNLAGGGELSSKKDKNYIYFC